MSRPGGWLAARAAVDGAVRAHGPRVLAGLVRQFGDFDLAEDAAQDAVAVALARWPVEGIPENPAGWLVVTARRRALDRLRRRQTRHARQADVVLVTQLEAAGDEEPSDIPDERLALVFTCCHPALSQEAQVALALRALCGLSVPEIARSFLVPEPTIQQRIVRAKRKILEARIPYEVPGRDALPERTAAVLAVVYLVFNEGYLALAGGLLRDDLATEAIRLARVLVELLPDDPEVRGLLALLLLHHARRAARTDADGVLVTLEDQDRSRWNRAEIAEGAAELARALAARASGPYQIQAAIAALHAEAPTADATDWHQIAGLYGVLRARGDSPVLALNQAVAVAMAAGPELGLQLLQTPEIADPLADYHLLHAARADLCRRVGRTAEAAAHYRAALARVTNAAERAYLERRLARLEN
jgi:RNA polymerase sigma-70 factor (ECF subfamily)